MTSNRAPKQWSISKLKTINLFENWQENVKYTLSLDSNFTPGRRKVELLRSVASKMMTKMYLESYEELHTKN